MDLKIFHCRQLAYPQSKIGNYQIDTAESRWTHSKWITLIVVDLPKVRRPETPYYFDERQATDPFPYLQQQQKELPLKQTENSKIMSIKTICI